MKVDQFFFQKMTTRGEISHRDIAHKPRAFHLSETFVVENIRGKHCQIMQCLILSFFRELPLKKVEAGLQRFLHI